MSKLAMLVQEFADNVAAQSDAIQRGDHKAGNRYAKRYINAFQEIRSLGNEGRDALSELMHTGRDDVKGMTAAFLLRYKTKEAYEVLRNLALGEGLVAFSASESIARWDEGSWQLDPLD